MTRSRKIIHMDLDAFFCAVEELNDPSLHGKPFAVGGDPETRGVVSSCSYPARALGIHSAMPMARAVQICPSLIIVRSQHLQYEEKSAQVMAILNMITPLVEQISVDEAFMDVSDLPEDGETIALGIQKRINDEIQLPCSFGVAANKLTAKIANSIGKKAAKTKNYPNAINVIQPGNEANFLAPLPIGNLWGVGEKSEKAFRNIGIRTIGQLANYPANNLLRHFGNFALDLQQYARGIDNRPVCAEEDARKSVSQETTFSRDCSDETKLRNTIQRQSENIGFELRQKGLKGNTIRIKLRWSNFSTITRQMKLDVLTNQDSVINQHAQALFYNSWVPEKNPVRLIGVAIAGIDEMNYQLSFLSENSPEEEKLLAAADQIKLKFGKKCLMKGIDME